MKILVGTLHTIENEFEAGRASVQSQTYKNHVQHVIHNLPNKEAHATLFRYFQDRNNEFDLLVKMDADMVLSRPTLFAEIVEKFVNEPQLEHLQIWVHDWYTDRLIGGLNIYRNTVRWNLDGEPVFVESSEVIHHRAGGRQTDRSHLAPAAYHCPDPSPFQAFHFGIHKGVKVLEGLRRNMPNRALEHAVNLNETWAHFLRNGDIRLAWAALGGELALRGDFGPADLDYSNPNALEVFESKYVTLTATEVKVLIRKCCRANGGILPLSLRFAYLMGGWRSVARTTAGRVYAPIQRLFGRSGLAADSASSK